MTPEQTKIPSRLPNGRYNPVWAKQYREKRKAAGNPVKQAKYDSVLAKQYRKTEKGKASWKRWNESEKAKIVNARYRASAKGQKKRQETGEDYASRIIHELKMISRHNSIWLG